MVSSVTGTCSRRMDKRRTFACCCASAEMPSAAAIGYGYFYPVAAPQKPGAFGSWELVFGRCDVFWRRLEQFVLVRVSGGRRAGWQVELGKNIAQVTGDGFLADVQRVRDRTIGFSGCDQSQHFNFAARKSIGFPRSRGERKGGNASSVWSGAKSIERLLRGIEL